MHKFSRTLLVAGVLAFGTLSAACGDKVTVAGQNTGVQLVTVTPPSASLKVGESIILSGQVTADAASAKTVTWTTSSAAVATVDATGKVTGVGAGTASITATSTADPSKAASSVITVTANIVVVPTIAINGVTQNGVAVNLGNTAGQIDVTVNTSGGGLIEVFVSTNCTAAIGASDVAVASQTATSAQSGTVTLSFNTAQLTAAGAPRFANGAYCIKTRLTNGTQVVVAANTVPITLNNLNTFAGAVTFASVTGGPTSAVSSINGLNYNAGTLTAKINPVIFTSTSPVALITGYLTRNGELNGAGVPAAPIAFTNTAVTSGSATIVFTDTSLAGVNSIFAYTSLPAGDTLYITSATDAAGNPISVTSPVAVAAASGVRIDNDAPTVGTATFSVVPGVNGYIGANYSFAGGTANSSTIVDTKAAVSGAGGVTVTYYVGLAGATAFATPCDVTGLTAVALGSDLASSVSNVNYAAKVVVQDKLGNKICSNVTTSPAFGVDKIPPTLAFASTSAAANTGYTSRAQNFVFTFLDTISGFNPLAPLQVQLVRNGFATGVASECVIGTYTLATKTCVKVGSTGTFSIGDALSTNGYYTVTANAIDQAAPGNISAVLTRTVALDSIAPAVSGVGQTPASVPLLGTVTVTGSATDNLTLISARANLFYANTAIPTFARNTQTLGAFGNTVTSGSYSIPLATPVYTGLQATSNTATVNTAAGTVLAGGVVPQDSVSAIDVGGNVSPSIVSAVTTTAVKADTLVGFSLGLSSSVGAAPATSQTATTLTVTLVGTTTNLPNQPFAVDFYMVSGGRLVKVGSQPQGAVTDTPASVRTWTWALSVPLTAAATNTFYAVAVNSSGNAIITNGAQVVNP